MPHLFSFSREDETRIQPAKLILVTVDRDSRFCCHVTLTLTYQGKIGGNGAVQWGPTEGIVNRDPFVLLDVDFKEDYTLKKSAQHLQPTEEDDQGEKIEEIHDDSDD